MTANQAITQQKIITSFIVLCVVAILVVGVDATKAKPQPAMPAAAPMPTSQTASSTTSNATYKDGQYMATGSYNSPGGKQSVAVTLTLMGNKITDATVVPSAQDGVAQVYQAYFVNNFKSYVIGKNVNGLKLSRVAGSSLTSQGFNNALKQIKQQAAA